MPNSPLAEAINAAREAVVGHAAKGVAAHVDTLTSIHRPLNAGSLSTQAEGCSLGPMGVCGCQRRTKGGESRYPEGSAGLPL